MSLAGKIKAYNHKKALQNGQTDLEDQNQLGFHSVNISRNSSQTRHLSENVN